MSKAVSERMVKGFLDLFVLALLRDGSKHGYEMMRELKLRTGTNIGAGTLYPMLYELERMEFVSAEWVSSIRRTRRMYKVTEKGSKFLEQGFKAIDNLRGSTATFAPADSFQELTVSAKRSTTPSSLKRALQ